MNSTTVSAGDQALASQYNNVRKDVIVMWGEYAVTSGSANAYVLAIDAQFVAYADGDTFKFKTNFANTATCTIDVNSVGAKTLKDIEWNVLGAWAVENGAVIVGVYNWTDIIVISGLKATTANKWTAEMTTDAEAKTATDETRYINSKQAKDNYGITAIAWLSSIAGSAVTERNKTNDSNYTKVKEIEIKIAGTYTCYFSAKYVTNQANARLYKNGSALWTEQTLGNTYAVYTESFTFAAWDLVQIYYKCSTPGAVYVKDFYISFTPVFNQFACTTNTD